MPMFICVSKLLDICPCNCHLPIADQEEAACQQDGCPVQGVAPSRLLNIFACTHACLHKGTDTTAHACTKGQTQQQYTRLLNIFACTHACLHKGTDTTAVYKWRQCDATEEGRNPWGPTNLQTQAHLGWSLDEEATRSTLKESHQQRQVAAGLICMQ